MKKIPDPSEPIQVFTDARYLQNKERASAGAGFFQNESLVGTYRARIDEPDPFHGEFRAILQSIDILVFLDAEDIEINTDSEPVANLIDKDCDTSANNDRTLSYTLRAWDRLEEFDSWSIEKVGRDRTAIGHELAKSALEETHGVPKLTSQKEVIFGHGEGDGHSELVDP
jgi:ribonuclease HI